MQGVDNINVVFCQIEEIEVRRKEKELVARVHLPADAQAYQIRQVYDHLIVMMCGQPLKTMMQPS